jgi:two-component system, OmpR family, response regulator
MTSHPALKRILVVEDEPDHMELVLIALETMGGFTVKACRNGQQALEVAPVFAPDLILLDVNMPDLDGPATLHELRKFPTLQHTPVVFLTASVLKGEVEAYRRLDILDVIAKPFSPRRLASIVKTIWAHQPDFLLEDDAEELDQSLSR